LVGQSTFQDSYGNNFDGISSTTEWNFLIEDRNPPVILTYSPGDDENNVSLTYNLEISFDEDVVAQAGGIITVMNATTISTHEVIDITSLQVNVASNVVTINPSTDFAENNDYYVLISSGALKDSKGNDFGGISDPTQWNFTSGDYTAPEISILSPANGAPDVEVTSDLVITFDEDVVKNTGNITIYNVTADANHEIIPVLSEQVSIVSNVVTISSSIDFSSESDYYVLVENGAFQDLSGNNFSGIVSTSYWTFTTEDVDAPVIVSRSPIDGESAVSIATNLELTFGENIAKGTGNITIVNSTTSNDHEVIDVTTSQVTVSGNSFTINPSTDFAGLTDYYILIPALAITDVNGNEFVGITNVTDWNFTTGDASAPIVSTLTPADNASDVSISSNLEINFNETVVEQSGGSITIVNTNTTTNHEVIDVTSAQVTVASNVVTVNPTNDLDGETDYHVLISNGAFQDTEANNYGGISSTSGWNFTTEDITVPVVNTLTPADNATDISVDVDLVMVFSEEVVKGTSGNITIMDADANIAFATISITSDQVSIVANTVTINTNTSFFESTNYYVLIDNGTFKDVAGNNYSGLTDISTWNFITVDNTVPTVSNLTPVDNAFDVSVNANLVIEFSEDIEVITGNITIMNADADSIYETIDATTALVSIISNTVTINSSIDFIETTNYYVLIGSDVFDDLSGNSFSGISGITTWNFTTSDEILPTIVTVSPADDATNIAIDTTLQIGFSENVVANTGLITIMNGTTIHESIDVLSGQVVISSNVVSIDPATNFDGETNYYILIANDAFHDETGNSFAGITDQNTWNFVTEDISQPTVAITSSASGTVTGNFDVVITFSEIVAGFTSDDIAIVNGSIINFIETTTDMVWTVTIEPVADGNVTVDVAANVAQDAAGNSNTAATQFSIVYDSGVGFEDLIPYEISIYSVENRVIVEFINDGNYQFEQGKIEVYNLLGQKIVESEINDFTKFETVVEHVSQIYVVKVIIDNENYTRRLYIE